MLRTFTKETIKKTNEPVLVKGWVHRRRNMGKIVFIDLRDYTGLVQIVLVPQELTKDSQKLLDKLRPEFVVAIEGLVKQRGDKQMNKELPTGTVEILAKKLEIISEAKTPPFVIDDDNQEVNEELRLKYRYLDLRREPMKQRIVLRYEFIKFIRQFLDKEGFVEITTPILTKSTPEGARDYLVPSRIYPGQFYALPQSPQQYKQLLMVAGFERYFQIAPCFRDEDARADRAPGEFYQLDIEMAFVSQEEILDLTERLFTNLVKELLPQKKITQTPWPRLTWEESMKHYQTDRPDLRKNKNNPDELAFCWVIDFPLFEPEKKWKFYAPSHHMFTAPKEADIPLLDKNPAKVKSEQHDLVLNGYEVGGGSLRIHQPKIQEKVFKLIGFSKKQIGYFGHMLEAFEYGVPPHGGIAPGIDRLLMVLLGQPNLREVIAFPKSADAKDLMIGAPTEVDKEQLKELGIKIVKK